MRVRSDLFVSALVRRVFSAGGFAAVTKKGIEEAGAIYVRQRFRDGSETLYGPAPQALVIDEDRDSRLFEIRLARGEPQAIDTLLERERRFDSDFWVLEVELDDLGTLLPMAAA
ncbi:MAG: DUF1491 family protein [Rhizobium sp.]|nr:DUF1491 family protein [Rhizobium sp.]